MLEILSWLVSGYFCDLCDALAAETSLDSAGGNRQLRAAAPAKRILPGPRKQSPRSVPFAPVLALSPSPRGERGCRSLRGGRSSSQRDRRRGVTCFRESEQGYLPLQRNLTSFTSFLKNYFWSCFHSHSFFKKNCCCLADLPHSSSGTVNCLFSSRTWNFHSDKNPRICLQHK